MANDLETLLSKIEENERVAAIPLETVPWNVRPGIETAKNMADLNLEDLKKSYFDAVKKSTVCIFLEGDEQAQTEFCTFASTELDCFHADVNKLYENVAVKASPLVDQKGRFSCSSLQDLVDILRDELHGCNIRSMPMFDFTPDAYLPDQSALQAYIKDAIRRVVDDDLNLHYIEHGLFEKALAAGYNAEVCCLLIKGASKAEQQGLSKLCAGTATLTVPAKPNETNVVKAVTKIIQKFKGEETKEQPKENN